MPLDQRQRTAVEGEAKRRGIDPAKATAAAERIVDKAPSRSPAGDASAATPAASDKPILVGFAPFVRVREVRAYMGLTERIPDDDMMCGEFAAKYGGAGSPASPVQPAPGETATATQAATEGTTATAA